MIMEHLTFVSIFFPVLACIFQAIILFMIIKLGSTNKKVHAEMRSYQSVLNLRLASMQNQINDLNSIVGREPLLFDSSRIN